MIDPKYLNNSNTMKNLDQFLIEKEKEKKSSAPKVKHPDAGEDDELYVELMIEYRKKRRKDPEEADKIHEKARKLMENGKVTTHAIQAATIYD